MSAYLLSQPQQFFDNNGDPLSGGKVYTCIPGASGYTKAYLKDTYTDATGATVNPNPVILDSFGRCNMWGDGTNYKLFIFNSSNVPVDEIDNTPCVIGIAPVIVSPDNLRNKVRNPKFSVNQRGSTGTVTLASGVFGHDCWKAGSSGCTYTFGTSNGRTTLNISAGSLVQVIDGADLPYDSNTMCLSWGGTSQGKIGSGAYSASGVTGTATGGSNIAIEFGIGTVYEPQFEQGTLPSSFCYLLPGAELTRCQRYYRQQLYGLGKWTSTTVFSLYITFPTPMRSTPAALGTFSGMVEEIGVANRAISAVSIGYVNEYGGRIDITTTTATNGAVGGVTASTVIPLSSDI